VPERGKARVPVVRFCSGQSLDWHSASGEEQNTDLKVGHYTTSEEGPTDSKTEWERHPRGFSELKGPPAVGPALSKRP